MIHVPSKILTLVLLTIFCCSDLSFSQVHTLTAGTGSVLPGGTVNIPVLLSNDEGARGYSMGVAHSGTDLTLTAMSPGQEAADSNLGTGPDFEFIDLNPTGGTGGTYGCILSTGSPLDEIAVGTNNEIVLLSYSCSGAAAPGSTTSLVFSDTLGTPNVQTVISVVAGGTSISRIPTKVGGSVSVDTPPVTGLSCLLSDPCLCDFSLSWSNAMTYDSIEITNGSGAVIQTLAGTATTAVVSISGTTTGGLASDNLSVRGISNAVTSANANCTATCPVVDLPTAPAGVSCSVNQSNGETTVSWTNSSTYAAIEVRLDGALVGTLGGGATSTTVTIGGPGSYSVSVSGSNVCGALSSAGSCTAVRDNFFVRNDLNQDGTQNIADPVQLLDFLFGGGSVGCLDSADVNDDGTNNIADVVYSLNVIFGISVGGTVPVVPAPASACGGDPTADGLDCASFNGC
ncbi:MAG: hypothetical protein H8E43_11540 [Planctomycetia bacterium]|nr:hypothetical protein [Planctomycetia bacterium]HCW44682.1 hypothetical protein [Planctomycetota bacterium]